MPRLSVAPLKEIDKCATERAIRGVAVCRHDCSHPVSRLKPKFVTQTVTNFGLEFLPHN
jgi:hypothetical protein